MGLKSSSGLGYGQTWQVVTRVAGTTYYNTTGKPIFIAMQFVTGGSATATLTINGVAALNNSANAYYNGLFGVIPNGGSYVLYGASVSSFSELR